jgi:hypothetical protein
MEMKEIEMRVNEEPNGAVTRNIKKRKTFQDKIKGKHIEAEFKCKKITQNIKSDHFLHLSSQDDSLSTQDENICMKSQTNSKSSNFEMEDCSNSLSSIMNPSILFKYQNRVPMEYLADIWNNLLCEEVCKLRKNYDFIAQQPDVTVSMRAILIDWIVDICSNYKLSQNTLFLTVNIIDSYISQVEVLRTQFQLIGVTALFIACKYEEVLCPELNDFVSLTDRTYSKGEILKMEISILNALKFDITFPCVLNFFEILSLNFNFSETDFIYGKYLIESFMIDAAINKYLPSTVAIAATYIILKLSNFEKYRDIYTLLNSRGEKNTIKVLKECARDIFDLIQAKPNKFGLRAVEKKFSHQNNYGVACKGLQRTF